MKAVEMKKGRKAKQRDQRISYLLGTIVGIATFITGAILMKLDFETVNKAIPGVLVGAGCGLFGVCGGYYARLSILKKHPAEARKYEIEEEDERNVMIRDKARSKAFTVMELIYGVLMIVFSLMNVQLTAILLFVAFYLFGEAVMFYYLGKYAKEL